MLIKRPYDLPSSEITPEPVYQDRRRFLQEMIGMTVAGTMSMTASTLIQAKGVFPHTSSGVTQANFPNLKKSSLSTQEELTPLEKIVSYSNFYEFGTQKSDPMQYAHKLVTMPWSMTISGEVEKPQIIHLEDILHDFSLEERIYRLRCVEGWSMVIPWVGFPLGEFIKRCQPTSKAKYVQFFTLHDPQSMPGQKRNVLNWPYTEGLRIDEAVHPLTIFSVGLYGKTLPNENGAPLRLVVPWKYGFKSIKSIVRIEFVEQQPLSSWEETAPSAYGFYSNVNPQVSHPRWSQAKERRIGEFTKRKTMLFNGYADQVASLYAGMDLRKYY